MKKKTFKFKLLNLSIFLCLIESISSKENQSSQKNDHDHQALLNWQKPVPTSVTNNVLAHKFVLSSEIFCVGRHLPGMPGATQGPVPVIRMYGVTLNGNSVLAHIHGFAPYFFVPAQQGFKREHCEQFRVTL